MNICLLTPTFLPKLGGVEIVVSSLAEQFLRAGHGVVVVTQWPRKGRGQPEDAALNYPIIRYPRPISFLWSFGLRGITKSMDQAYRRLPFDVIHCHMAYPVGPVGLRFGRSRGIPVVITTHGSDVRPDSRYRQRGAIWTKISQSLRQADAVTAISEDMKALLETIVGSERPISLITNAVDMTYLNEPTTYDPSWPVDPKEPFLLYLGGLAHKKGVDCLLEAVEHLCQAGRFPSRLIVAGDGPERDDLEQFCRLGQLSERVRFVGRVTGDFKKFLFQNCRYLVMPSRTEGAPLVALEAFSCGKPLVASNVGGLKELMANRPQLGLLVPSQDPQALARGIEQMESKLPSLSPEPIRQFARQFDWPVIAGQYVDLYQSLCVKK